MFTEWELAVHQIKETPSTSPWNCVFFAMLITDGASVGVMVRLTIAFDPLAERGR